MISTFQHFNIFSIRHEYLCVHVLQLNMLMRLQEAAGFTNTDSSHESNSTAATGVWTVWPNYNHHAPIYHWVAGLQTSDRWWSSCACIHCKVPSSEVSETRHLPTSGSILSTTRQTDRQTDTWLMYCSLFVLSLLLFVVRKKNGCKQYLTVAMTTWASLW